MRNSVRTPPTSTTLLASRGKPWRRLPMSVVVPPTSMTSASRGPRGTPRPACCSSGPRRSCRRGTPRRPGRQHHGAVVLREVERRGDARWPRSASVKARRRAPRQRDQGRRSAASRSRARAGRCDRARARASRRRSGTPRAGSSPPRFSHSALSGEKTRGDADRRMPAVADPPAPPPACPSSSNGTIGRPSYSWPPSSMKTSPRTSARQVLRPVDERRQRRAGRQADADGRDPGRGRAAGRPRW